MKCPHCLVEFNDQQTWWSVHLGRDAENLWLITRRRCPTCGKFVFELENGRHPNAFSQGAQDVHLAVVDRTFRVWPKGVSRTPLPQEVPASIREDFKEACLVLADSAKASAALSRRCLQSTLRESAKVKPGDLFDEIQQVLDSKTLPSAIANDLDAIRVIGNFAAHPIKSKSTGEIVPVEPHEAEWNLDVLELLFDFYYALPAKNKAKRDALNKKLVEAGKQPLK